jgi:hypothetical protein
VDALLLLMRCECERVFRCTTEERRAATIGDEERRWRGARSNKRREQPARREDLPLKRYEKVARRFFFGINMVKLKVLLLSEREEEGGEPEGVARVLAPGQSVVAPRRCTSSARGSRRGGGAEDVFVNTKATRGCGVRWYVGLWFRRSEGRGGLASWGDQGCPPKGAPV